MIIDDEEMFESISMSMSVQRQPSATQLYNHQSALTEATEETNSDTNYMSDNDASEQKEPDIDQIISDHKHQRVQSAFQDFPKQSQLHTQDTLQDAGNVYSIFDHVSDNKSSSSNSSGSDGDLNKNASSSSGSEFESSEHTKKGNQSEQMEDEGLLSRTATFKYPNDKGLDFETPNISLSAPIKIVTSPEDDTQNQE